MYKQTEQEYIHGCYTRYGTRPLNVMEIKAITTLSNGMCAVAGFNLIKLLLI